MSEVSRRSLLHAAGGFTFFALAPNVEAILGPGRLPDLVSSTELVPVFTAIPYLQPGNGSKLEERKESVVIAWQTDSTKAHFEVQVQIDSKWQSVPVVETPRNLDYKRIGDRRVNFAATIEGLSLDTRYQYRVMMNNSRLIDGFFTTRKPRGKKTRFVAFGDNSMGQISDRAIAYQAYKALPDFVMNTGDNVYAEGLDNEYARYFFPVYNADLAGPRIGAPLLRSVPFYSVLANHDINSSDQKGPICDFDKYSDGLGIYTNLHLPLNGPKTNFPTPIKGNKEKVDAFLNAAGNRFPRMGNYSFDYGDIHFLCLDSNRYVDPTDEALTEWVEADLSATDAIWKIVVYHHPAFNVGAEHYDEQHMRALTPLFERHGVDLVLSGHEHNYQRTRPLRFVPSDLAGAKAVGHGARLVPGTFTVDREFDGKKKTKPNGIIYLTTGAGGNSLYDREMNNQPATWLHEEDARADYVDTMISDRHSLTVIDVDGHSLTWAQVDEWGVEIDRAKITKNV